MNSQAQSADVAGLTNALADAASDLPRLFQAVVTQAGAITGGAAVLVLRDPADPTKFPAVAAHSGDHPEVAEVLGALTKEPIILGVGPVGASIDKGEALILPSTGRALLSTLVPAADGPFCATLPLTGFLCVPLLGETTVMGALVVGVFADGLGPQEIASVRQLADLSALVIGNRQLQQQIEDELGRRRRAEVGVRRCEELVQAVGVGLIAVELTNPTRESLVILNNAAGAALMAKVGSRKGATVGEAFPALVPLLQGAAAVLETGEAQVYPEISFPNGHTGAVHLVALPGGCLGVVCYDLSLQRQREAERRVLDERVREAQKLESLGALAGGIAHDFNNLLVTVLGNTSLALEHVPAGGPLAGWLSQIEVAARRASDLTRQMLAYSGRGRFVVEPVDLNTVITEMSELLQGSISKRATLKLTLSEAAASTEGDVAQLQQVLLNLLKNASDAIGEGSGQITVTTGITERTRPFGSSVAGETPVPPGRYTTLTVSDTGKELVARALHDYGKRRSGPFVAINMAAIPKDLIESELFGHEKGAFTGALTRSSGRFEQAEGGTLFLDEIGDMPMEAQTRLLRVLQQGEYTTVGGRTPIKTNVRIVAATNKDLRVSIQQGLFREDLFFRLNVVPIRLPPLRERVEDIPDLMRHFFTVVEKEGLPRKQIDAEAMDALKRYRWPGNVRELENLVRRLTALYPQETITGPIIEAELQPISAPFIADMGYVSERSETISSAMERHLGTYFGGFGDNIPPPGLYHRILREVEPPLIAAALAACRGNQIRAAELLGLNRNTLRKKIRELDMQVVRTTR